MGSNSHPAALYQLRIVTRILALVILLLVLVGFLLPTEYRVERSISINAPLEIVSDNVLSGQKLSQWMHVQDGRVELFDGVLQDGDTVRLFYDESDEIGELTLLEHTGSIIRFDVRPKLSTGLVHNRITLENHALVTEVKWIIEGNLSVGLLSPYLAFFANDIAGQNFEVSLLNLKQQIESRN
ncbi:polyketide cyclase [Marinomonas sp. 2405UD66-6]|uniref:polyketide cyclase n=1 Tax=Marinomonas sp. 2405UD66-6 TaxID=3391834 RepID=UPI0039C9E32C